MSTLSASASSSAINAIRSLPLFMAYCPDAPNALARRLEVRPVHFERWAKDRKSGRAYFGLGYLPPPSAPPTSISLPAGIQPMAGSLMIFHSETLDSAWERIREDIYYTAGVWDKDKLVINQFINPPEGALYP